MSIGPLSLATFPSMSVRSMQEGDKILADYIEIASSLYFCTLLGKFAELDLLLLLFDYLLMLQFIISC